jgi:hypothetical protein
VTIHRTLAGIEASIPWKIITSTNKNYKKKDYFNHRNENDS